MVGLFRPPLSRCSLNSCCIDKRIAADGGNMASMNQMPGAAMMMPGQPAQDFGKLYKQEKENLDIVEYKWVCDGVEDRLLKKWGV